MTDTILIRLKIDREAAVLAGKGTFGTIEVPVPEELTEAQRKTLLTAPWLTIGSKAAYDLTRPSFRPELTLGGERFKLPAVPDASPASIALLLDAYDGAVAAYRQGLIDAANKNAEDALAAGNPAWGSCQDLVRPELQEKLRAAQQERDRKRRLAEEQRRADLNRERDRERRAAQRETAEREAWIREHGSDHLQRLLAEKIEHKALYRDERLAKELGSPEPWNWHNYDRLEAEVDWGPRLGSWELREPRNPPQKALALLDAARKQVPTAELRYFIKDPDVVGSEGQRGYVVMAKFLGRDIYFSPFCPADPWEDDQPE